MIRKMLYRIPREGGGYTVSLNRPEDGRGYNVRWRLIADEGRAITDGESVVTVIDLFHRKDCEGWYDCDLPETDEPTPEELAAMMEPFRQEYLTKADEADVASESVIFDDEGIQ